ncbi:MAG: MBL fold metallo-hydrolase [Erysipelotrichaceae bacterium]
MKLTVLVDNNCYIDKYYLAEPALSFYIEDDDTKLLFDCGYSSVFYKNATKMNIDLTKLTHIVLSHGHNDHSGGLKYLVKKQKCHNITLLANNICFFKKIYQGLDISSPLSLKQITRYFNYQNCQDYSFINKNLLFITNIERVTEFEKPYPIGETIIDKKPKPDYLTDDSALVYKSDRGLVIISGCSHSGICNIIEKAKRITNEKEIFAVIGGFHLFEDDARLEKTIQYFIDNNIKELYPCHCVSLQAKSRMLNKLNVKEVAVSMHLEF